MHLCETDPSVRMDVMHALIENISAAGIEVVNTGNLVDMEGVCLEGTLQEVYRKALRHELEIEGVFVGTLAQKRVNPFLLTEFELRLIANPSGRLIWSIRVRKDNLAAMVNTRSAAVKAAERAVDSFKKDMLDTIGRDKQKLTGERKE